MPRRPPQKLHLQPCRYPRSRTPRSPTPSPCRCRKPLKQHLKWPRHSPRLPSSRNRQSLPRQPCRMPAQMKQRRPSLPLKIPPPKILPLQGRSSLHPMQTRVRPMHRRIPRRRIPQRRTPPRKRPVRTPSPARHSFPSPRSWPGWQTPPPRIPPMRRPPNRTAPRRTPRRSLRTPLPKSLGAV